MSGREVTVTGAIDPAVVFAVASGTRVYDINGTLQTSGSPFVVGETANLDYQPGCGGTARPNL